MNILIEIKKACMLASYVIMTYTFLLIMLTGRCVWTEPNNLILYTEGFFLALSWIGFFYSIKNESAWIFRKVKERCAR